MWVAVPLSYESLYKLKLSIAEVKWVNILLLIHTFVPKLILILKLQNFRTQIKYKVSNPTNVRKQLRGRVYQLLSLREMIYHKTTLIISASLHWLKLTLECVIKFYWLFWKKYSGFILYIAYFGLVVIKDLQSRPSSLANIFIAVITWVKKCH